MLSCSWKKGFPEIAMPMAQWIRLGKARKPCLFCNWKRFSWLNEYARLDINKFERNKRERKSSLKLSGKSPKSKCVFIREFGAAGNPRDIGHQLASRSHHLSGVKRSRSSVRRFVKNVETLQGH
jgi:hypothetical protein